MLSEWRVNPENYHHYNGTLSLRWSETGQATISLTQSSLWLYLIKAISNENQHDRLLLHPIILSSDIVSPIKLDQFSSKFPQLIPHSKPVRACNINKFHVIIFAIHFIYLFKPGNVLYSFDGFDSFKHVNYRSQFLADFCFQLIVTEYAVILPVKEAN